MKVKQYPYLSPEANELRHRDGIPLWGVHPCEVDHLRKSQEAAPNAWLPWPEFDEASALRDEIEGKRRDRS